MKTIPGTDHLLLIWNNAVAYGLREGTGEGGLRITREIPLRSAISRDGGQTWEHIRILEDRKGHINGYPSVTSLDDEVFVTWYTCPETTHGSSEVLLKIFSTDWYYA